MKTSLEFKLPSPPTEKHPEWKPVVFLGGSVPWGYDPDPHEPQLLQPNVDQLNALEKAKLFLKEYSLANVAIWLTKQTGRQISAAGLRKRINLERKYRQQATTHRYFERRAKEAARKAKELEERIGGIRAKGETRENTCPCCGQST